LPSRINKVERKSIAHSNVTLLKVPPPCSACFADLIHRNKQTGHCQCKRNIANV